MATDSGEKTEQATEKRMKEVRSKGQLTRSQDLTAWVAVGTAAIMVPVTVASGAAAATTQLFRITELAKNPTPRLVVQILGDSLGSMGATILPMFLATTIAVLAAAALQGGIHFKKFAPRFEHFNILEGVKRSFGMEAGWQGVKALIKTVVVGIVLMVVIQGLMPVLMTAGGLPASELIAVAGDGVGSLIRAAVAAGLILAAADVFVVIRRNRKRTRMTKKEVTDEHKSSDGDPLIKSQRRSRQLAMSRNRMMAAIVDADVVLVNPTDFAVALSYEPGKSAPRVVAKGAGVIAARIREQAETDRVPIVKDIPLARALFAGCELGQEIPVELYNAVAKVLAFVQALKKRGASAGTHSMTTLAPVNGGI